MLIFGALGLFLLWMWVELVGWYDRRQRGRYIPPSCRLRLIDWDLTPDRVLQMIDARAPYVAAAVAKAVETTKVFFKPGEPQTFLNYDGQSHIVSYLEDAVRGLAPEEMAIEPQLFLGPAGIGKTLLARVIANELQRRAERLGLPTPAFLEVFPADIPDLAALDAVMRRVVDHPGSVMLIDELHDFSGPLSRKLYSALADNRFLFSGDATPTELPPTTFIGCTTDAGALHSALRRRWLAHQFKGASKEQLLQYVLRRGFPIVEGAARQIVERTYYSGAPWEALQLRAAAVTAAKGRASSVVEECDVERVFAMQEIDAWGLRWLDRHVIQMLFGQPRYRGKDQEFVCFAASENDICQLAGIDRAEYRDNTKPRLLSRGLLQVRPGYGQTLTPRAVDVYGHLVGEKEN